MEIIKKKYNCEDVEIKSRDADIVVKYPLRPTEFEIQAAIYYSLTETCGKINHQYELKCNIKSEVTIYIDRKTILRFDLMLFNDMEPICGIEVKKQNSQINDQSRRQKIRYEMFERLTEIPVLYCKGMGEVAQTIKKAERYL